MVFQGLLAEIVCGSNGVKKERRGGFTILNDMVFRLLCRKDIIQSSDIKRFDSVLKMYSISCYRKSK